MKLKEFQRQVKELQGAVRQAKVHVVNNLTRAAKKLREKKGSEEQKAKCGRKADRMVEEIKAVRKMKEKPMAIKSLQNTSTFKEIVANPKSTLELRAESRIFDHPKVKSKVEKFRSELPHWQKALPTMMRTKPAEKPKAAKRKAISEWNVTDNIPAESDNLAAKPAKIPKLSTAKKVAKTKKPANKPAVTEKVAKTKKPASKPAVIEKVATPEKPPESVAATENSDSLTITQELPKPAVVPKRQGTLEVRPLSLDEPESSDLFLSQNAEESELFVKQDESELVDKTGDLFCLRGERVDDGFGRKSRGRGRGAGRGRDAGRGRGQWSEEREGGSWGQSARGGERRGRGGRGTTQWERPEPFHQQTRQQYHSRGPDQHTQAKLEKPTGVQTPKTPGLHPSWEAKKKQREQETATVTFQGKKITFDD